MKNRILGATVVVMLLLISASCKGDKKNPTAATEPQPVAISNEVTINYKVDPKNSSIKWTGSKPTGEHTGTIAIQSGIIKTTNDAIESASFLIDMKSIAVTDLEGEEKAGLEGHLKGMAAGKEDHFFNVEKFPTATFEITKVSTTAEKTVIQGNLTMRGIKKNISFPATTTIGSAGLTLTTEVFTINRTDWGVNYGSKSLFDNLGDKFIHDDIALQINLKGSKM